MQNIKLLVAYDGTRYLGWQKTSMGLSIEGSLQEAIEQVLQHPIALQAASRTDAGVHAVGQVVNFTTPRLDLDLNRLKISLNSLLSHDLVVLDVKKMDPHFHPTLACVSKEYRYYICYGSTQLPQHRFYSWHYHYNLNLDRMRQSARCFLGLHDFSAFCNARKNRNYIHYERSIQELEILKLEGKRICIRIKGPNFLYKMVRNIVGTLAYVGNQKLHPDQIPEILRSQNRVLAGITAPAHGLFLQHVFYPDYPPYI